MELEYIEHKLREIHALRKKILKEMNIEDMGDDSYLESSYISKKFKRNFESLDEMKIACIMDEFTFHSYDPQCKLLQVSPNNWLNELKEFKPDLFFLESAWRGMNSLWNTKVAHLSDELIEMLNYLRQHDIPIIFWNKEDPIHFNTFLATAKYADFVFTTDIDCIKSYKSMLKHDRVFLLPFAAQTKYHNPLELYDREDKFCFAGAYYKRYPERMRDLDTFVDSITQIKGLDIYDRNYYLDDPNYAFPKVYKQYIVGNLKPDEIDKAYKGYRFNINMNSVKQSQSMCARRVFELLASNTVTVSNYSRAVRNLLGDLVVCTDDGKRLKDEISMFDDEEYYRKYRLLGLRKVLTEHTYQERLTYIVNTVYTNPMSLWKPQVAIIAVANTEEQLLHVVKQFERQKYESKHLYIVTSISEPRIESSSISFISESSAEEVADIQNKYDYISFLSNQDYYGENYIIDLVLALKYSDDDIITKGTFFSKSDQGYEKKNVGNQYKVIQSAYVRMSMIKSDYLSVERLCSIAVSIEESLIESSALAIDEYNYCMNEIEDTCEVVDDLYLADKGISVSSIEEIVNNIKGSHAISNNMVISPDNIFKHLGKQRGVSYKINNGSLAVTSEVSEGHQYIYIDKLYTVDELKVDKTMDVYLDVDYQSRFSFDIVVVFYDGNKNKLSSIVKPCNRKISVDFDSAAKYVKFGFRISGAGRCTVKQLIVGEINTDSGCYLNKSNTLLIADNYPSYDDLYRYAFIHTRLIEYKKHNHIVDVFKLNDRYSKGYSEFSGIDVTCGHFEELRNNLFYASYDTILIHFLNEDIWNCIKESVKGKKIIVWVHGAEIQPWWRREYNYSSEDQLSKAKVQSDKRVAFWKEIFDLAMNDDQYSFHFVFVSDYFAREVFEDNRISFPEEKYSIIHNYIDNTRFNYIEKTNDLRKKILSIRPYANRNYANELTVKAIQLLSKEKFFKELEFRIIGKGELFHSTIKPIKKYKNVIIEERFLRQEEIADLHKQYGIFLVPTRMDSQGVSRDEAMSSGLVPITNRVAAIPEFVDEHCGMLAEKEDYVGLAESIKLLYHNPDLFRELSINASKRVRAQSGYEETILKEINLL